VVLGLALSMIFAGGGGSNISGSDPNSLSAPCVTNKFVKGVNETAGSIVVQCTALGWSQLTGFPSPCPANQFVTAINATITCSTVAWAGLTGFPSACPSGQFVTGVGLTLTCTSVGGVTNRETLVVPYTTLTSTHFTSDITTFTLPKNQNLSIYFASGNETGVTGSLPVRFVNGVDSGAVQINAPGPFTQIINLTVTAGNTIIVKDQSTFNCTVPPCATSQTSVTADTLGNTWTNRLTQNNRETVNPFDSDTQRIASAVASTSGADRITITWTAPAGALAGAFRTQAVQYANVVSISNVQGAGWIFNSTLTSQSLTYAVTDTNNVIVGGLSAVVGCSRHLLVTPGPSQIRRVSGFSCTTLSQQGDFEEKNETALGSTTFSESWNVTGFNTAYALFALQLNAGSQIFIQIVDTTAATQVVIYQLDVSISPFYQGCANCAGILASFKNASQDRILTVRASGGAITTNVSGFFVVSIV
jgi:hypothetical protein